MENMLSPEPLAGVRVLDFSRILAGPYASMMLADFGADVIKLERPTGDDTRHWLPPADELGRSTYFASVNRNKRSLVCDLDSPEGRDRARRLAITADVIIENFRPGVMSKFGLDAASIRSANPRVIYCSISGFGTGSGASVPGYDLLVQAMGGLMSITGAQDGPPVKSGVALVDVITGQNAVAGILLALRTRETTGSGDHVHVDLLSSLLAALTNQASSALATGEDPPRLGNAHPSIAPYEVFHCRDRDIVIAVGNDKQFAALTRVLNTRQLVNDPRFVTNPDRVRHREELRRVVEAILRTRDAVEWHSMFCAAGVPAGLVNTVTEAFDLAARWNDRSVVSLTDETGVSRGRQPANPIRIESSPVRRTSAPPGLGEHDDADWRDQNAATSD